MSAPLLRVMSRGLFARPVRWVRAVVRGPRTATTATPPINDKGQGMSYGALVQG